MTTTRALRVRILVAIGLVGMLSGGFAIAQQRAAAGMAAAASGWLDSLTAEQRARAVFPLNADERTHWNFIPTSMFPRNGLSIKDMTEPQRQRAHDLLKASLSQAGYDTVTAIIELEILLREIEGAAARGRAAAPAFAVAQNAPAAGGAPPQGRRGGGRGGPIVRDPELYFFSVFGTPSAQGGWAMRVEGHHLSMHFSIDGAKVAVVSAPFFLGSNPAEVRVEGPKAGLRVLGAQEDTARALLAALTDAQRTTATMAPAPPGDIVTGTTVAVDPLSPAGLMASDMTAPQRDLLMKVLDAYMAPQTADVVADRMAKIRAAGLENIGFAWAGSTEKGQRYHYRVQGPTFLIEHNNTQNQGNHVHSVWRDFNGDFGRDLLAEHLKAVAH